MSDISTNLLKHIIEECRESENRLYDAAQIAQNRGLKLVLKSYAEQHGHMAAGLGKVTPDVAIEHEPTKPGSAIERGWVNLRAGLTVRRQYRQQVAIQAALEQEDHLLSRYEEALQHAWPADLGTLLTTQHVDIRTIRNALAMLAAPPSEQTLLVRLFDEAATADQVVAQLEQAGVPASEVYQAPITRVETFDAESEARLRSRWETALTSMLIGGGIGALFALFLYVSQRIYFPNLGGLLAATPLTLAIEMLLIGILTGALFALIAGALIGESAVEDDAYLYEESLGEGAALVAVYASPEARPKIEQILGIKHQFEVEPQGV